MAGFPKIAVPAARSSASVLKIRRRIVLGLLVLAIVMSLVALLMSRGSGGSDVASAGDLIATPVVAFSEEAARDFLDAKPTDVPVATGVDPTFGYDQDAQPFQWSGLNLAGIGSREFGDDRRPVSLVTYYVQIKQPEIVDKETVFNPKLYRLTVPMVSAAGTYPRLAAQPSLLPTDFNDGTTDDVAGLNVEQYSQAVDGASEEVTKVIRDWGFAFVEGGYKDEVLKRITGDTRPEATYTGLGGWSLDKLSIVGVLPAPVEGEGYVARVVLAITPPAGTGPNAEAEYDVWVAQTEAGQANPPVIAWGTAGTAETLLPYQNAVIPQP